jgi:mannose-6-phosphate isomerase
VDCERRTGRVDGPLTPERDAGERRRTAKPGTTLDVVTALQHLWVVEPQARERVWGGQRLQPHDPPIGEIWCAFGDSRLRDGAHAGETVGTLALSHGAAFLGDVVAARFPGRFPLLIKLLDCADWLSVQVHPNDEQAQQLEGPGHFGKTAAWHFIAAAPGSTILAGTKAGITPAALADAIRTGRILDMSVSVAVHPGETYLLHAGTMHALGPAVVLYEVQQSSDLTYRVYDWDRPASAGRQLHIDQAVAVTDPRRQALRTSAAISPDVPSTPAVRCSYFALDVLHVADSSAGDTEGRSFHALTVKSGVVRVATSTEEVRLNRYETAIVAGSTGAYTIDAVAGPAAVLRASVPER